MAQGKEWTTEEREIIIQSLQSYLEAGFSRNKACQFVGLPPQTLSNWVVNNEALGIKLASWENAINKVAMQNIIDAINKEGESEDSRKETTKWWLERKMRDDFATKIESKVDETSDVTITYKWDDESSNNDTLQTESVG